MTEAERKAQFFPHSMRSGYGGQLPASAHALNYILSGGTVAENVAKLTGFLCEAMKFRHEEAMLEGFEWLCKAWERFDAHVEMRAAQGISHEAFGGISETPIGVSAGDVSPAWTVEQFRMNQLDRLIDLYALTPSMESCIMLKVAIIQKAVREFLVQERTEIARKAFSFFLAMGYMTRKGYRFDHPYSDVRERLTDRCVTKAERDALENAVREGMGSWKLEDIEAWYVEWSGFRFIHADLLNVFGVVWGRKGGVALMDGSLADRALLARFDRMKRSPVAIDLFRQMSDTIADFDIRIASLVERMTPDSRKNGWRDDGIGQCEELYGTIQVGSEKIGELVIALKLPEGFPDALGRDVARRARQHVEQWKEGNGQGIVVFLTTMLHDGSGAVNSTFR